MGSPDLAIRFLELLIYPQREGPPPAGLEWVKEDPSQQTFGAQQQGTRPGPGACSGPEWNKTASGAAAAADLALNGLRALEAGAGRFSCVLPVSASVSNRFNTLHGGATGAAGTGRGAPAAPSPLTPLLACAATITDSVTTAALFTLTDRHSVSLALSCDYLGPMPAGEDCRVEASVVRLGGRTAHLACSFTRASTGELVAQGRHTKVLQPRRGRARTQAASKL